MAPETTSASSTFPSLTHLHADLQFSDIAGGGLRAHDRDDGEAEERDERDKGASKGHLEKESK